MPPALAPPVPVSGISQHPLPTLARNLRRPLARDSVSLKHSSPASASSRPRSPASSLANNSSASDRSSNAQTWFDKSNNNVRENNVSALDHVPTFFFQRSSDETPDDMLHDRTPSDIPQIPHGDDDDDTAKDFRSVIDDLTVQNKRLKKKVRQYEKIYDRSLHSERMFEIRMHGLSSPKKQELEELLKQFALSANGSPYTPRPADPKPQPINTNLATAKPSSSRTSTRVADSGYGSMTASHRTSSLPTSTSTSANFRPHQQRPSASPKARDRNIHSYLHDIPQGLLPRESPTVMSDDAKKTSLVSRLEQLFRGRGAAVDGHQHQIQQQEVSQLAAKDDRSAIEARGQRAAAEGIRQAQIMQADVDDSFYQDAVKDPSNNVPSVHTADKNSTPLTIPPLDQRPTRPLDLDPNRAQLPEENFEYLRHLGFPVPQSVDPTDLGPDDGWVYLNVLVNMAQLHTLSVTTAFVRDALKEVDSGFELSEDSRKVRWVGGKQKSLGSPDDLTLGDGQSAQDAARKRPRPGYVDEAAVSSDASPSKKKALLSASQSQILTYTPLFARQESSSDAQDISMDDGQSSAWSPLPEDLTREESALTSSLRRSGARAKKVVGGPLIFYKNPQFFSDLSGDKFKSRREPRDIAYQSLPQHLLGQAGTNNDEPLQPVENCDMSIDASLDVNADTEHAEDTLDIVGSTPGRRVAFADDIKPVEFIASGVGCVYPADHFTIHVNRSRELGESAAPFPRHASRLDAFLSQGSASSSHRTLTERVTSKRWQRLEPSALPAPVYAVSSNGSECGSDNDSDSDSDASDRDTRLRTMLQQHADDSDSAFSDDSHSSVDALSTASERLSATASHGHSRARADDEQSLDLLAAAREADPDSIRAREREYDAEMAERLADEIPAGSSAATCGGGGGSGYNSPVAGELAVAAAGGHGNDGHDGSDSDDGDDGDSSASS